MKFLLSILVIIGNLNVLLANNDNCRENDLNALIVRGLRTDFDKQKNVLEDQKAEIEDLRQEINNTSSELKELRQNTSSELAEIKESIKNVSEVVVNIKKDVEKSTSRLDDLKTVTDEIKEQMEKLDQATEKKTQVIAFNVADAVNYTGNDAIKFSNIILNEGDAYNKDTGIFTAPLDGIYQFNAHICGNETIAEIDYNIIVNSQWIVTGGFTVPAEAADAKCTSFSAVALVRKGENVRVGGMSFSELQENNNDVCSFSGVLIKII